MKTKLNLHVSMALLSMLLLSNSFAQKDFSGVSAYRFSSNQIGVTFSSPASKVMTKDVANEKVLRRFNKSFKNAENIEWKQLNNNFLAMFVKDDIPTRSLFDRKGKMIYTINYPSEKQLPPYIKSLIKDYYSGYNITSSATIFQDGRKIWIVKLAGNTNYIEARIENGDIEEIENFQKAN